MSNTIAANQLLAQMRAFKSQASGQVFADIASRTSPASDVKSPNGLGSDLLNGGINKTDTAQFSTVLKSAVDTVNHIQKNSGNLQTKFEQGEPGVSLTQVMVASQKASISFQAMTQVRNRLIEAYKDVMNMPV